MTDAEKIEKIKEIIKDLDFSVDYKKIEEQVFNILTPRDCVEGFTDLFNHLKDIKQVLDTDMTGSRLKKLIQDSSNSQKDFIKKFNKWLQDHHPEHPYITEKDISRWITGKVKPRKSKIQLFAEYFDVDVYYLEGSEEA